MIGIITYDAPHRKTQDLLSKLILNGYSDIHLIVIPWVTRKNFKPIFIHRSSNPVHISIEDLSKRLGLSFTRVKIENLNEYFSNNHFKHIMIAGAGILPEELAKNHKIINSHPGFLPFVKGLDAYKWAIFYNRPIGVTTHYISDKADEGELIEKKEVPMYFEDSFHSVANRIYETEIEMLVNSIRLIENKTASLESLADEKYKANMRMPHHYEIIMMNKFDERRKKAPSYRDAQ